MYTCEMITREVPNPFLHEIISKQVRQREDREKIENIAGFIYDIDNLTHFGWILRGVKRREIRRLNQIAERMNERATLIGEMEDGLPGISYEANYDASGFRISERIYGTSLGNKIDVSRTNGQPDRSGWKTEWSGTSCGIELTKGEARSVFARYGALLRNSSPTK